MSVRHQLRIVWRFDPDCVRPGLRRLPYDDGQPDGGGERRERLPIDILRQDGFENILPGLVGLNTLCSTDILRHADLLPTKNANRVALALDLAQIVSEPIFDISRLVEAPR